MRGETAEERTGTVEQGSGLHGAHAGIEYHFQSGRKAC